jgi:hypothetical protein
METVRALSSGGQIQVTSWPFTPLNPVSCQHASYRDLPTRRTSSNGIPSSLSTDRAGIIFSARSNVAHHGDWREKFRRIYAVGEKGLPNASLATMIS